MHEEFDCTELVALDTVVEAHTNAHAFVATSDRNADKAFGVEVVNARSLTYQIVIADTLGTPHDAVGNVHESWNV